MFNVMRYINDIDFQIVYYKKEINVINYERINYMEDSKISLSYPGGVLVIKGDNLRVRKLLDNEIVVCGNINNLEFKNN